MNEANYNTMPQHYTLCFSGNCPMRDTCLHALAAQSGKEQDELVTAVNHPMCQGEQCRFYSENKVATMAFGMVHSYHDVKADDIAKLRNTLIQHFGRGSYYLRRNGLQAITPDEQQYISDVFRSFGYEVQFDRTEEDTLWL